ncbi:MAG TPA: hypothetical protein VFH62_01850 [Dehalococcoidia bacterium]|jgi:hypothetical protein|nr:hypothetical protein [Dehalococcoidia bacterium]
MVGRCVGNPAHPAKRHFFADNTGLKIPFFLASPPRDIKSRLIGNHICHTWLDYNEKAEQHQAYTGKFGFWSGESCASPLPHCVHNGHAREIFDLLADKARELGQ